jgi:hypothetical protein
VVEDAGAHQSRDLGATGDGEAVVAGTIASHKFVLEICERVSAYSSTATRKEFGVANENCLARRDPKRGYNPMNCFWRPARSKWEARTGIEDVGIPNEPEVIPLTVEQATQRAGLPKHEKKTFDVWLRILWRAENYE